MDAESLYLQLGQLVAEMPNLGGSAPITADINRWLGRAAMLVRETGNITDVAGLSVASDNLNSPLRDRNTQQIAAIVYRALAHAEADAPAAARGSYVGIGATFDALKAIGQVLAQARGDVLVVDAYMDVKTLTDFAPMAAEGVRVRLLSDCFYTKPDALVPAPSCGTRQTCRWGTT